MFHTNWWQRHRHYFWYTDNIYSPWIFLFSSFFVCMNFLLKEKVLNKKKSWKKIISYSNLAFLKLSGKKPSRFFISMKGVMSSWKCVPFLLFLLHSWHIIYKTGINHQSTLQWQLQLNKSPINLKISLNCYLKKK